MVGHRTYPTSFYNRILFHDNIKRGIISNNKPQSGHPKIGIRPQEVKTHNYVT